MNNKGKLELNRLDKSKPIYMIGIGGISMSALAIILKNAGFSVLGSDFKESTMTNHLKNQGIHVSIGHKAENIVDVSAVVYTAAIKEDNPELAYARTLNIPVVERAVLLGEIMKWYKMPIAVSGTHGKTTTTSMLSEVLLAANLDPTILVGGILPSIGGNMHIGSQNHMVTEACEYCGSFLEFNPKISLILNVEEDHLDYFKDINDIVDCFNAFAKKTPADGLLVVNGDDPMTMKAVNGASSPVKVFSLTDKTADFYGTNVVFREDGCADFTILKNGDFYMDASLFVPGIHNVKNALAVIATADFLGITPDLMQQGFQQFRGTKRRFEHRALWNNAYVIDDYAHHPTEIKTTLETAKKAAGKQKVYGVFQPHTYTRAFKLKEEFAQSFKDCDRVIVVDIYAAREKDTGLISSKELTHMINLRSDNAVYAENFETATNLLKELAQPGDYIITLGAGDVNKICELLCD